MTVVATLDQVNIADLPAELRQGQQKAIPALIDYFGEHDRGILWMCCGSGKTVALAIYAEMAGEELTIVFTPRIKLVKQWRGDYLKWLPTTQARFMCVCSEKDEEQEREIDPLTAARLLGPDQENTAEEFNRLLADARSSQGQMQVSTDTEEIATFLRQPGRKVIISTYVSSPVYAEAQRLANIVAGLGIYDEAQHTATGDRETPYTYPLHDRNIQIRKRVFATATVRHHTKNGMTYSMDNPAIYGGHVLNRNGEPDPWTMRQAIEFQEAPPYRIVFSFVTDPTFDRRLLELPIYRDYVINGRQADPGEVRRLLGQAIVMERMKAAYGVRKVLGFFRDVYTSRLYTAILNRCKQYPELFPNLSRSAEALSISTYESRGERERREGLFHTLPEIEVNNSKLYLFGTDEETIDAIHFGDQMMGDENPVQACGRAQRYAPDKIATFIVPVMLPHYGVGLDQHAQLVNPDEIQNAFSRLADTLDGLADMDPVLRHQIYSGGGKGGGHPGIVRFDFPDSFVPAARTAIEVATWRTVNPDSDFLDNLNRDATVLARYRLEQFPTQTEEVNETEAAQARAQIRIIPRKSEGYETTAYRMNQLRNGIKAYYEAQEREGRYSDYNITISRVEQVFVIYGWDKSFVLQDDFEEELKKDADALAKYRLEQIPPHSDSEKEVEAAKLRAQIKILPREKKSYNLSAFRMAKLRNSIKAYYEAGEKESSYGEYRISAKRVEQVFRIYNWDKEFVMQDEFEEDLKQDLVSLMKYRLEQYPSQHEPEKEAEAVKLRAQIKIIPHIKGYETASGRMGKLRTSIKAYYESGEVEKAYGHYRINPDRVERVFRVYGWNKDFVLQDDFEADLKGDVAARERYRLEIYPIQANAAQEEESSKLRAQIIIIPKERRGHEKNGTRMVKLRRALKLYHEAGEIDGTYAKCQLTAKRVTQIYQIYGWGRDFVLQDDFVEELKQNHMSLLQYRLEQHPLQSDAEKEAEAVKCRAQIRIIPVGGRFNKVAFRMKNLRQSLRRYHEAGQIDKTYGQFSISRERVNQIFAVYDWDWEFVLGRLVTGRKKEPKRKEERHHHVMQSASNILIEPTPHRNRVRLQIPELLL